MYNFPPKVSARPTSALSANLLKATKYWDLQINIRTIYICTRFPSKVLTDLLFYTKIKLFQQFF